MLEEGGAHALGLGGSEQVHNPLGFRRAHDEPGADVVESEEWVGAREVEEGGVEGSTLGGKADEVCSELVVRF